MKRQILGVLAASVAAPYIVGLVYFIYATLNELISSGPMPFDEFLVTLLFIVVFGTYGLFLFGLPVLIGASTAAFVLHIFKVKSPVWTISMGWLTGLCCGIYIFLGQLERDLITLSNFLLSGALCGWIYWRIAFRQTPKNSHAIDAA